MLQAADKKMTAVEKHDNSRRTSKNRLNIDQQQQPLASSAARDGHQQRDEVDVGSNKTLHPAYHPISDTRCNRLWNRVFPALLQLITCNHAQLHATNHIITGPP
jgi:hypothetical protein